MKIRYAFTPSLMLMSTYLTSINRGSVPEFVYAITTFTGVLCAFFGIMWFVDMVGSLKDLNDKVIDLENDNRRLKNRVRKIEQSQEDEDEILS